METITLTYKDTYETVQEKLSFTEEQMDQLLELGEQPISDKEMYLQLMPIMGEENAKVYMNWIGAEDYLD